MENRIKIIFIVDVLLSMQHIGKGMGFGVSWISSNQESKFYSNCRFFYADIDIMWCYNQNSRKMININRKTVQSRKCFSTFYVIQVIVL